MTHLSVDVRPVNAAALLELAGVTLAPSSPLSPFLAGLDPDSTSEVEMEEAGLIIRDESGLRTNATLALALSTLAQPQEVFHLHSMKSDREAKLTVANVAGHRVGLVAHPDVLEILFPLGRGDLLVAIRQSFDVETSDPAGLDLLIPAAGHFLAGVMARLGAGESHSFDEIAESARADLGNMTLAASLVVLDSEAADSLHADPARVAVELGRMIAAGALEMVDGRYRLEPSLGAMLEQPAVAFVEATRLDVADGSTRGITGLMLGSQILGIQSYVHLGVPSTRLTNLGGRQLADSISGLLFTESELEALSS